MNEQDRETSHDEQPWQSWSPSPGRGAKLLMWLLLVMIAIGLVAMLAMALLGA